ncbi:MAG: HlyC/CorC family transporter [Clostridia bacterium]|nr:HlyC/CorC family transporter [Clostridia bacterium]
MIGLLICVALSSFFSASETAFMAVKRSRLKTMQQNGDERAGIAYDLTEDYDRLLTTVLVGNNIVNIAGTAIATVFFTSIIGNAGATVSTVVMTILILLIGEVAPKMLAKQAPENLSIRVARPMKMIQTLLTPVNGLFGLWRNFVRRVFNPEKDETPIEEEIITMVDEAQTEGGMDEHEGELIRSAVEFNDSDALDIMTPRVDVEALEDTATMEEAEELFRKSGYSRLPVYHEDMDHIVGILHEKDFYRARHAGVQGILRIMVPPVYASATLELSRLLKLFQNTRTHLVVVLDEFGGTEGIVTLEDVLEELVGEIYDEHDDVTEDVVTLEDGSIQVNGGLPLQELCDILNIENTFEADTVGGWAAEVLGQIPTIGMEFDAGLIHGTVTGMDRRRVTSVRVEKKAIEEKERVKQHVENKES